MKITIPPRPAMIPSANKFVNMPSGNVFFVHSLNEAKELSIKSIGIPDQS